MTSRRRSAAFLSVLAGASLVVAASGNAGATTPTTTPEDTATEDTAADTTAATEDTTSEDTATEDSASEGTATEGTEAAEGAGAEIGGSACGTPHGPYEAPAEAPSGEVRVAWNQAPYSFNSVTNRGNAVANNNPLYIMNGTGFQYYDADLNLINNDQFGTCTLDSLDPLTITYTINEGVTWSDGTPVDATDIVLSWAGQSGVYNDASTVVTESGVTAEADGNGAPVVIAPDGTELSTPVIEEPAEESTETTATEGTAAGTEATDGTTAGTEATEGTTAATEGTTAGTEATEGTAAPTPEDEAQAAYDAAFDPETGALLDGYSYKESTGVNFDGASESLQLITTFPTISEDGRSATFTWDSFYVDYLIGGPGVGVPAHVVAQEALGIEDPVEAKAALLSALEAGAAGSADMMQLKAIADTWNRSFDATSLPDNPGIYASFGPYNLVDFTDDGTMTFEAREDYTWGPMPHLQTIVYTIITDPDAAVQAMANEEVDIIQPQATADILTQLEGIADRGILVEQADGATYEHVDLAVNNGGPFDPATYDGDAETARAVREAFLKTLPRQEIVDRLIVPLNENAEVRNTVMAVPGSPGYDALVAENGNDDAYAEVDIDGATALLEEAGVESPTIRLMYASDNPRRVQEYELIRDSAAQAGITVEDAGREDWSAQLSNTSVYDAALFGWQTTSINVSDSNANFSTDGLNNFYGYSNETVDALYEELVQTSDPARQAAILLEVEQNLVVDAFGLPIFQHPQITAWNSNYVEGVASIAIAPTVFWNFWDWTAPS